MPELLCPSVFAERGEQWSEELHPSDLRQHLAGTAEDWLVIGADRYRQPLHQDLIVASVRKVQLRVQPRQRGVIELTRQVLEKHQDFPRSPLL